MRSNFSKIDLQNSRSPSYQKHLKRLLQGPQNEQFWPLHCSNSFIPPFLHSFSFDMMVILSTTSLPSSPRLSHSIPFQLPSPHSIPTQSLTLPPSPSFHLHLSFLILSLATLPLRPSRSPSSYTLSSFHPFPPPPPTSLPFLLIVPLQFLFISIDMSRNCFLFVCSFSFRCSRKNIK